MRIAEAREGRWELTHQQLLQHPDLSSAIWPWLRSRLHNPVSAGGSDRKLFTNTVEEQRTSPFCYKEIIIRIRGMSRGNKGEAGGIGILYFLFA